MRHLFFIKSPFDLISRVVLPFLLSHVILGEITTRVKRVLHEPKNKTKVAVAFGARLPNFKAESSNIVPVQSSRLKSLKKYCLL